MRTRAADRSSIRTLVRRFANAVVGVLAPGIGANEVMFGIVNARIDPPTRGNCATVVAQLLFRPNPALGVPIYLQLMEQVKHAIETGALRPGEQLPGIRPLAEELVINPNTVAKAYRE